MYLILIQVDTTSTANMASNPSETILPWVSIGITFILGVCAIAQSYHYYTLSSKTNEDTKSLLSKLNDVVIKLELVNSILTDRVFKILDKTIMKATNMASSVGGTSVDSMKKDLEKTMNDGSERIEGQIKSLTDSVDKNQLTVCELKTSINIIANAVQDVFNKVINNIDDFEEGSDEYHYMKSKILERCITDLRVSVKDIFGSTSPKISILNKMNIIEKLKEEKSIDYEGDNIYESTILFLVRNLETE
jgi:hypothetical protein